VIFGTPAPVVSNGSFHSTSWQSADASATLPQSCLRALLRWYYINSASATDIYFGLATTNAAAYLEGGEVFGSLWVSDEIYLEQELETSSTSFYWMAVNGLNQASELYLAVNGYEFEV
jgi:hypothetical protein